MNEFPRSVIERLGYYVYSLTDPRTRRVFYIGKGTGNRVFMHAAGAVDGRRSDQKLDTIRAIERSGRSVRYAILRHGLIEKEAFEVESALIDLVGLPELTNKVIGHATDRRGRMTVKEVVATYRAEAVVIREPSLLIIINRQYRQNMPPDRLYEITRGNWVLGQRRDGARYAFAVYKGLIREVYAIRGWRQTGTREPTQQRSRRSRFSGEVAADMQHYVGGDVSSYIRRGCQSPVLYLNC